MYASVYAFAQSEEIAVIDVNNFKVMDMDPNTPGIQNLGGKKSIQGTKIERQVTNLEVGPRGKYLYLANYNSVSKLNVDENDPNFNKIITIITITRGINKGDFRYDLSITDAGDRVYVVLHKESKVLEYSVFDMS